ncbi:MAG: O-antigen ligase family protein [Gemmatimonadaceae bacterium]
MPAARPGGRLGAISAARGKVKLTGLQWLIVVIWFILLFDPQWFVASFGLKIILRFPMVLLGVLLIAMFMEPREGDRLYGILAWTSVAAINLPFAYDRGASMPEFRSLIFYYVIGLAVIRYFRSPRVASSIIFLLLVGQYLWWGLWGLKSASVYWHPNLDNFDGYGPLMATGIGPGYYYAAGSKDTRSKVLGYTAAVLSVIGCVNSFARGAVLGLIVTAGYIWLRSPNKGRMTMMAVVGMGIVVIISLVVPGKSRGDDTRDNFFDEMSTMFDDSEGSTGDDRKVLWAAAMKVFYQHPILGAGLEQFGPDAAMTFKMGDVGGAYAENPSRLYARALHSNYFQLLSEFGLVGAAIFIWMLVEFWRRCHFFLKPSTAVIWQRAGGAQDIRSLALGLESGMVGFLATGVFFNQLFQMWFYGLVIMAALLETLVKRAAQPVPVRGGPRPRPRLAPAGAR